VILDACTRIRQPAVLATVVSVEGSAYRRPGARMLIFTNGGTSGMVSGGCLETDLAERAQDVLLAGGSQTVVYDMRSPDDIVWGLGLGCDGEIRVLLEALDPEAWPPWCTFAVNSR
jgi:xanthine dehydrogenase accessory factor